MVAVSRNEINAKYIRFFIFTVLSAFCGNNAQVGDVFAPQTDV